MNTEWNSNSPTVTWKLNRATKQKYKQAEKAILDKKNVLVLILETQERLGSGLRVTVKWSQVPNSRGAAVFD